MNHIKKFKRFQCKVVSKINIFDLFDRSFDLYYYFSPFIDSILVQNVSFIFITGSEDGDGKGSNLDIVMELQQAEISGMGSGDSLEKIPEFKDRQSEIRWKLNKVRKQLNSAKTFSKLARRMKESLKLGMDKNQGEIEKIIKKAEKSLVRTGEQMGLDYMHFKREAE